MALSDLSLVTKALITLITESFNVSEAWSDDPPLVFPDPPDRVSENGLGFYLYHIEEDSHYKNLPSPGNETPPVKYVPMALNLYYQLSASSSSDTGSDSLLEQQMMGIAIKALHDYPFIDDTTKINKTVTIFPHLLRRSNNQIKITLQSIPPNEAVNYWTAGTSSLSLAAYYQISVILLEPEKIKSRSGRVLTYGIHTFLEGAPRLENSENRLSFIIPGQSEPEEITLRSAQVPVGDRVTLKGTGLSGDNVSLFLKNSRWTDPVEVDPAWAMVPTIDKITIDVQETASAEVILPGVYSAFVTVTRRRTLPSGEIQDFDHNSNECAFMISPRIDDISSPDSGNIITVRGYLFPNSALSVSAVNVYLSDSRLTWRSSPGALTPGDFTVTDPPVGETLPLLQFIPPDSLVSGQTVPIRIFVNGAESAPNWIPIS